VYPARGENYDLPRVEPQSLRFSRVLVRNEYVKPGLRGSSICKDGYPRARGREQNATTDVSSGAVQKIHGNKPLSGANLDTVQSRAAKR